MAVLLYLTLVAGAFGERHENTSVRALHVESIFAGPSSADVAWGDDFYKNPSSPLLRLGRLYGWGEPALTQTTGTFSWIYMPLISLALKDVEDSKGWPLWSIGQRARVPENQEKFWRKYAGREMQFMKTPICTAQPEQCDQEYRKARSCESFRPSDLYIKKGSTVLGVIQAHFLANWVKKFRDLEDRQFVDIVNNPDNWDPAMDHLPGDVQMKICPYQIGPMIKVLQCEFELIARDGDTNEIEGLPLKSVADQTSAFSVTLSTPDGDTNEIEGLPLRSVADQTSAFSVTFSTLAVLLLALHP